jgi:alpha-galactosidase
MRDALYKAGRPMVYSICEWGTNKPWEWGKEIGHLWRATEDIINCFDCKNYWGGLGVLQIIDLMAGNDVRSMSKETIAILTNPEVISVDQDKLGISAIRWMKYGDLEIWFKPLDGGDFAFCLINRGKEPVSFDQDLKTTIKRSIPLMTLLS